VTIQILTYNNKDIGLEVLTAVVIKTCLPGYDNVYSVENLRQFGKTSPQSSGSKNKTDERSVSST
jgi:hypothetical protein